MPASEARCLHWSAEKFAGHWYKIVLDTLSLLHDAGISERLGFLPWADVNVAQNEAWVKEDQDMWATAWNFVVELSCARCESAAVESVSGVRGN